MTFNRNESKTFCTRPFTSLYVGVDGKFKFCCVDNWYQGADEAIPSNLHITTTNLLELWNSPQYRLIRLKLLNELQPKICMKCFHGPNDGVIHGARRPVDSQLGSNYNNFKDIMGLESITFIELWFENKCNLKCRMCNPYNSDQLIAEWNGMIASNEYMKSKHNPFTDVDIENLTKRNWTENPAAWDNLAEFLNEIFVNNPQQVITLIMSGGEPMLCDGMYKLLDYCVSKNFAQNIKLCYKTNLTVLPSKMLSYWRVFKKINLQISVEGHEKTHEYIRYPAKWSKLLSNLEILRTLNNVDVYISPTIQAYNVLTITELYKWCLETPFKNAFANKEYDHLTFPAPSDPLFGPKILSVRVLPKDLKILAATRLMEFHSKYKHKMNLEKKQAEFVWLVKYMLSEDWSHHFADFVSYTKHVDKTRNQNILEIIPELKPYW